MKDTCGVDKSQQELTDPGIVLFSAKRHQQKQGGLLLRRLFHLRVSSTNTPVPPSDHRASNCLCFWFQARIPSTGSECLCSHSRGRDHHSCQQETDFQSLTSCPCSVITACLEALVLVSVFFLSFKSLR